MEALSRRGGELTLALVAIIALSLPPFARSRTDVLSVPTALAEDEALRLAPLARHAEFAPHVRSAAFQQIDAVDCYGVVLGWLWRS